jgi:D-3-phosphoglycerate dehydrogenase
MTVRTLENPTLVLDLLEWVGDSARSYGEVMDAWQTSCPRLPIWEDALESGFVRRFRDDEVGASVVVTPEGRRFLRGERPTGRVDRN